MKSAIELLVNEAETSEALAERHCARGDHRQAAWRYDMAAGYYEQAGRCLDAARCWGNAYSENQLVTNLAPTNVRALTE